MIGKGLAEMFRGPGRHWGIRIVVDEVPGDDFDDAHSSIATGMGRFGDGPQAKVERGIAGDAGEHNLFTRTGGTHPPAYVLDTVRAGEVKVRDREPDLGVQD